MRQIVLMTALTAASGLFGGGRSQCPNGACPAVVAAPAPVAMPAPMPVRAPVVWSHGTPAYAPQHHFQAPWGRIAPATAASLPMTHAPARQYFATTPGCATGACSYR